MPQVVDHLEFSEFVIAIGDGADPEVFTPRCSMNTSRGFNRTAETQSRNLPFCDDDAAPSATLKRVTAINGEISGAGVLERADLDFFDQWLHGGVPKNIRILVGAAASGGGKQYAMEAVLSGFNISSETKDVVNAEMSIESSGVITPSVIAAA